MDGPLQLSGQSPHIGVARRVNRQRDAPPFEALRHAQRDSRRELQRANALLNLIFDAREARETKTPELLLQALELVVSPEARVVDDRR